MPRKTLIIAQMLMTLMMAFCMSDIMDLVAVGAEQFQLTGWMQQFIIAWPIAFMLGGARPDRH